MVVVVEVMVVVVVVVMVVVVVVEVMVVVEVAGGCPQEQVQVLRVLIRKVRVWKTKQPRNRLGYFVPARQTSQG